MLGSHLCLTPRPSPAWLESTVGVDAPWLEPIESRLLAADDDVRGESEGRSAMPPTSRIPASTMRGALTTVESVAKS